MQLAVVKDKYKGHAKSPWLVVLPARLSPTGRRQYRRFATRADAASYAANVRMQVKARGEKPLSLLPAELAADATAASKLLEGTGLSLCDAVRQLLSGSAGQAVAFTPCLPSGGAGGGGAGESFTLPDILERVESAKSHQAADTTRTRRALCRTLFSRNAWLESLYLEQITPDAIQRALDTAWPASPTSWNGGRRQLHALFAYAIKRRLVCMDNPVSCLETQHVKESEITALPPQDLKKLFEAARPATAREQAEAKRAATGTARRALAADLSHLRPYIALCAFAGIRPTECARLRWQDVDFEDGIISVRAANSKTGGQRHIDMHPTLRAWLESCRPATAEATAHITATKTLTADLAALRARAGFGAGKWQADCLRHSYATYYLKARIGELTRLQLNMGHRSAQLLYSRYVNMAGTTRDMAEKWWQILPD